MKTKDAIDFIESMIRVQEIMRDEKADNTLQDKFVESIRVIKKRLTELESENGKLKLTREMEERDEKKRSKKTI